MSGFVEQVAGPFQPFRVDDESARTDGQAGEEAFRQRFGRDRNPDLAKERQDAAGFGSVVGRNHGHRSPAMAEAPTFNLMVDILCAAGILNHMVEESSAQLDSVFHALGDPTRRRMLRVLAAGERTVGQLAEPFAMSLAAASKHIKALEQARLIRREVRGRTHVCRLEPAPLASAHEWLGFYERFWTGRLDRLEQLLRAGRGEKSEGEKK